ncbi:MAG: hypothetical protein ABIG11_00580, partial [bacterium]
MRHKFHLFCLAVAGICVGLAIAELTMRMFLPEYQKSFIMYAHNDSGGKFYRYDELLGWDGRENVDIDLEVTDVRH